MEGNIFSTASGIFEEYDKYANHEELPISVDVLKEIIQKRVGLKTLKIEAIEAEQANVLGQVKFFYPVPKAVRTIEAPTTAIIRIQKSLNFCWRRMVVCKELCHCLIDTDEGDRVTTPEDLVSLFEGLASGFMITDAACVASEKMAEMLAMELLYPYELRKTHAADLKAGKITPLSLALRYRIPIEYAEFGMHDSYMAFVAGELGKNKPKPKLAKG